MRPGGRPQNPRAASATATAESSAASRATRLKNFLGAVQRLAHFGAAAFQRFHPHGAHVGLFDLFSRPF